MGYSSVLLDAPGMSPKALRMALHSTRLAAIENKVLGNKPAMVQHTTPCSTGCIECAIQTVTAAAAASVTRVGMADSDEMEDADDLENPTDLDWALDGTAHKLADFTIKHGGRSIKVEPPRSWGCRGISKKKTMSSGWASKPSRHKLSESKRLVRARLPTAEELGAVAEATARAAAAALGEQDGAKEDSQTAGFRTFDEMRRAFLAKHKDSIIRDLGGAGATLAPAPVSSAVGNRLCRVACRGGGAVPAYGYHGTEPDCRSSIYKNGLRVPGTGGVSVKHGSAHGVGIYTATEGSAWLSRGFSSDGVLLVCGIVVEHTAVAGALSQTLQKKSQHKVHRRPAVPKLPMYGSGRLKTHSDTKSIRHVGNARVIFDPSLVAPLFVGTFADIQRTAIDAKGAFFASVLAASGKSNRADSLRAGRRRVLTKGSDEIVWLPPEATTDNGSRWHKRRYTKKARSLERKCARALKAEYR